MGMIDILLLAWIWIGVNMGVSIAIGQRKEKQLYNYYKYTGFFDIMMVAAFVLWFRETENVSIWIYNFLICFTEFYAISVGLVKFLYGFALLCKQCHVKSNINY